MSCTSPFVYVISSVEVETEKEFNFSGSVTIPGYTLPSFDLCLLGWNPAHCDWVQKCGAGCVCRRGGLLRWCKCCTKISHCDWVKGSHFWYDCTKVPNIPIFPKLTLSGDCAINLTFTSEIELEVTEEAPLNALAVESVTINEFTLSFSINGTGFKIPIPSNITFSANSEGVISSTVPIFKTNSKENAWGLDYDVDFAVLMLFCLDPEPPSSWINVQLVFGLAVSDAGQNIYNTSFSLVMPIIPPPDE